MLRPQRGIVDDGMLRRMWGTTRDITDLKESERALNASERRMTDLLEAVHLPSSCLTRMERFSIATISCYG